MLHGKMTSIEKETIMNNFRQNKIKVLISTSVLEVGIDIPNATVMLIEGAERFGLAQLHQFRGRIGRGNSTSYCFLSLSEDNLNIDNKRLQAMQKYQDGLSLAKMDLKFRGSGDFYGTAQSGIVNFKFASLFDHELIDQVDTEITRISKFDPNFEKYPKLKRKIENSLNQTHLE